MNEHHPPAPKGHGNTARGTAKRRPGDKPPPTGRPKVCRKHGPQHTPFPAGRQPAEIGRQESWGGASLCPGWVPYQFDVKRGVIPGDSAATLVGETTGRCARPRARSPQGDGELCLSPAAAPRSPDAGEDARAPRGKLALARHLERRSSPSAEPAGRRGTMPITSRRATVAGCGRGRPRSQGEAGAGAPLGEALVPERGARRATGNYAYHQPPRHGRGMRARTPALPGGCRRWRASAAARRISKAWNPNR
jgi:hypothetical protein